MTTIALAFACHRSSLVERLELWTLDWRIGALDAGRRGGAFGAIARAAPVLPELIVVSLDDTTLEDWDERLPVPRTRYAEFIDQMKEAGARLVLMDVFLVGKARDPLEDQALASAIKNNGRVVYTRRGIRDATGIRDRDNPVFFSQHMLLEASAFLYRDSDSVVRRYGVGSTSTDGVRPSAALFAARELLQARDVVIEEGSALKLGGRHLQLTPAFNGILLDLAGPCRPFELISLSRVPQILQKDRDHFANKVVLLGHTYSGAHDLHPTPASPEGVPQMEGCFIHAYAIRDLVTGNAGWRVPASYERLLLGLLMVASAALFWRLPLPASIAGLIAIEVLWSAFAFWAYLARGAWMPLALPGIAPAVLFVQVLGFKLREERNTRRNAEGLLSSYFSPAHAAGLEGPDDPNEADNLLAVREILAPEKYEITGKLGQGGMSVVFRAIQHPLGRTVALKFISPRLYRDRDAVARFLREARLAGRLMHKNLVAVFDSGESRGVPYIALEFVEGENLKSLIARRLTFSAAEVVAILVQALDGLEHVHRAGIIHRDIKSENILIAQDGTVKITDFGIAKSDTGDAFQTMQEVIVGTPAYLSPEQIKGVRLTPASDLYSLGIVLYEMLTGSPPFLGDSTGAILLKHLNDLPPDLVAMGIDAPRALLAVLKKCLEKDPAHRYESAGELRNALLALNLGVPVVVIPGESAPPPLSGAGSGTLKMPRAAGSSAATPTPPR